MESELVVVSSGARDPHEDRGCWLGSSPLHPVEPHQTGFILEPRLLQPPSPSLQCLPEAISAIPICQGSPVSPASLHQTSCCFPLQSCVIHTSGRVSFTEQGCLAVVPYALPSTF